MIGSLLPWLWLDDRCLQSRTRPSCRSFEQRPLLRSRGAARISDYEPSLRDVEWSLAEVIYTRLFLSVNHLSEFSVGSAYPATPDFVHVVCFEIQQVTQHATLLETLTMTEYFGLRGKALNVALIWAVIMPAYILYRCSSICSAHSTNTLPRFGYNNAVGGGLLSLPSWIETFPRINTETTTGETKTNNSRVQVCLFLTSFLISRQSGHSHCIVYPGLFLWLLELHLDWR